MKEIRVPFKLPYDVTIEFFPFSPQPKRKPVKRIHLNLTEKQAATLFALIDSVCDTTEDRVVLARARAIRKQLADAGVGMKAKKKPSGWIGCSL